MPDIRALARVLGGDVAGTATITCPGPGHSPRDRSLSVTFSTARPGDFVLHSHASDDWRACREHVRRLLKSPGAERWARATRAPRAGPTGGHDHERLALALWRGAREVEGSPVAAYLAGRGLADLVEPIGALRYHPACPFFGERTPAMLALVRDVLTDRPRAVHRTALSLDGRKAWIEGRDRGALAPLGGGAVKLTPDDAVSTCLGIGEGIETTLSLRALPEAGPALPVWSLISAGGVAAFPVLPGVEALWIAVDADPAGERASRACAARWRAAGREVLLVRPKRTGADLNDVARRRRPHG